MAEVYCRDCRYIRPRLHRWMMYCRLYCSPPVYESSAYGPVRKIFTLDCLNDNNDCELFRPTLLGRLRMWCRTRTASSPCIDSEGQETVEMPSLFQTKEELDGTKTWVKSSAQVSKMASSLRQNGREPREEADQPQRDR